LHQLGGNACEYYMGPTVNPGTEVNIAFGGRFLCDPSREPLAVLEEVVAELYRPQSTAAAQDLAQIFVRAEEAYFTSLIYDILDAPGKEVHELYLTWPHGDGPFNPDYLSGYWNRTWMDGAGRSRYAEQLRSILNDTPRLKTSCRDDGRLGRIEQCIGAVLADIKWANQHIPPLGPKREVEQQ
jgi:hypothetical protein